MHAEPPDRFTVKLTHSRVLEYEDAVGRLDFYIDLNGQHPYVEVDDRKERREDEARFMAAAQRARKFLESYWGVKVDLYDSSTVDPDAIFAEGERTREKMVADGKLVIHSGPKQKGRSFRPIAWLKALFFQ